MINLALVILSLVANMAMFALMVKMRGVVLRQRLYVEFAGRVVGCMSTYFIGGKTAYQPGRPETEGHYIIPSYVVDGWRMYLRSLNSGDSDVA